MSFVITLPISLHGWTPACHAQSIFTWNDFAGDFYDIGSNWTPNGPPGSNDIARFGQNATYTVFWDSLTNTLTPDVGSVEVLLGNVTFLNQDLIRHNFEINDSLSIAGSTTQLTISGLGLLVNDSTLVDGGSRLEIDGSHVAGSTLTAFGSLDVLQGTVTFSNGATGDLLGDLNLNVDSAGTAEFNVTNGSDIDFEALQIGNGGSQSSSSLGTMNINGAGSSMVQFPPATASVVIGNTANLGSHTLNVTDGGLFVGRTNTIVSDSGNLNVVAGQYSIGGDMIINGAMSIQQGGSVSSQQGIIAQNAGDSVVVNVKGAGSQWNNSGNLTIGNRGNGNLDIGANALVTSSGATIAERSTSESTVNVFEGSSWNNSGQVIVGQAGTGTLNIASNGVVTSNGGLIAAESNSAGTVNVDGAGSRWDNPSIGTVGESGIGALNITNGGSVEFGRTIIGNSSNAIGTALVSGPDSQWNTNNTDIGFFGQGDLTISNGGQVDSGQVEIAKRSGSIGNVTVNGPGSQWNTGLLTIGDSGSGSLTILGGAIVTSSLTRIGQNDSASGEATIGGTGSQWLISNDLAVSDFGTGTGTLNLFNGLVRVDGVTRIGNNGVINLFGGRFEFGESSLGSFDRINVVAPGSSLAGIVKIAGVNDLSNLVSLQNPVGNLNEVVLSNNGLLHGSAILKSSLNNQSGGELRILSSVWSRFEGTGNVNAGEINNFGGVVDFAQEVTNTLTGFIGGRGQFIADSGWTNEGVMAFSGTADILGDLENVAGGTIVSTGGATTTFFDDVVHNGSEIRTSAGSNSVFFGEVTGAGDFTGTGTVFFEGDLRPGNSPDIVSFDGSVVMGTGANSYFELAGLESGLFDQLLIDGDLALDGMLTVELIEGFQLTAGDEFLIADVAVDLSGQFFGLGEGDLVGRFGSTDLFISYAAGNGNDVGLFASAVPEPGTFGLLGLTCLGLTVRRRRD